MEPEVESLTTMRERLCEINYQLDTAAKMLRLASQRAPHPFPHISALNKALIDTRQIQQDLAVLDRAIQPAAQKENRP